MSEVGVRRRRVCKKRRWSMQQVRGVGVEREKKKRAMGLRATAMASRDGFGGREG